MKFCYEFKTPEEALEHLFKEAEKSLLKQGRAHIWHKYKAIKGNGVTGATITKREDLIGRHYNIEWCNDIISIEFLDAIFMHSITGRSYPDKTHCCVVRFPTTESV